MGQSSQALVDSAYKKIGTGDYNGARHDFHEAIDVTPRGALEYVNRGLAYNGLGDYDKAVKDYNKAIEIDPNLKRQILPLQEAASRRQADAGIHAIGGAPKGTDDQFNPKDGMGYYCRGLEYIYFDKTDLAIADFKKATEIDKDFVHAYGKLGMLYSQKENFNDAITAYSTAFQLNPNCGLEPSLANAYYCRGSIFLQKEDNNKAIADLDQAIRLNGKYAFSYFNRGMAYFANDDFDQSIKDFSQAILCGMNMAIVYGNRGEAYRRKGQMAAAIQDLEKAISLDPDDEDWKKNLKAIQRTV